MFNKINLSLLFMAVILSAGFGAQAQSIALSGTADCEGWNATATLNFPSGVYYSELDYSVVLMDQAGAEVTRFEWAGVIYRYENPVMMSMHGEAWGLTLDSTYVANLSFHFLGEESVLNFDLVCGVAGSDPAVEPCRQSPGFWKNHPQDWPMDMMMLGGVEMDQSQLIQVMRQRVLGNRTLLMARELIAAKLNIANGCDDSINAVIEDADDFLVEHPLSEGSWRNRVPSSRDLRIALSVYNKAGCGESGFEEVGVLGELGEKSASTEQTSFGALKAFYR